MTDLTNRKSHTHFRLRVGLSTTAIYDDLSGYFFGNFRDKAAILYDDMLPPVSL